jgi:hypothetical protein
MGCIRGVGWGRRCRVGQHQGRLATNKVCCCADTEPAVENSKQSWQSSGTTQSRRPNQGTRLSTETLCPIALCAVLRRMRCVQEGKLKSLALAVACTAALLQVATFTCRALLPRVSRRCTEYSTPPCSSSCGIQGQRYRAKRRPACRLLVLAMRLLDVHVNRQPPLCPTAETTFVLYAKGDKRHDRCPTELGA